MLKLKWSLLCLIALTTGFSYAQTSENAGLELEEDFKLNDIAAEAGVEAVFESESQAEVKSDKKLNIRKEFKSIKAELKKPFVALKDVTKKKNKSKIFSGLAFAADILLVILAIFLPWLSVGIYTGWDVKLTVITLLLWFLGWLPGVVFGMLVLFDVIG